MNDFLKEDVFQTFIEVNRPLWMKLAMRILENREEAEDVVQETLAGLWEKRNTLEVVNPGAYVARSIWLNSLKRRTRRKVHLPLEDVAELEATQGSETVDAAMEKHLPQLKGALDRLPEEQRQVLRLRYQMDLSFKEIGTALQISLNTAASRTRYALSTLRKILNVR
ncbi:MAG TPA: sigma-70 family RNA polymerase sigma factor [bacterium]|jgi:RNA polymerase sigma factor (sigma-70 family)|nr:sigma-70 family RNA polymerase sigma factor [bacterium]